MEVLYSMVKYRVNLKYNDDGKTLNEVIIDVLRLRLQKKIDIRDSFVEERYN